MINYFSDEIGTFHKAVQDSIWTKPERNALADIILFLHGYEVGRKVTIYPWGTGRNYKAGSICFQLHGNASRCFNIGRC